jgi:hypothetical protein
MQADLDDFKTGWYGILLGLNANEIDELIAALHELKKHETHLHLRSEFEGEGGIGDIEIYFKKDQGNNNMVLEASATPTKK